MLLLLAADARETTTRTGSVYQRMPVVRAESLRCWEYEQTIVVSLRLRTGQRPANQTIAALRTVCASHPVRVLRLKT